jgi:hypothetical protein
LAELLNGSLTVESTLGEGSTFRLELPQNADPPQRSLRLVDQELHREPSDERPPRAADVRDDRGENRRVAIGDPVRG